ncbi:hypothetical protein Pint_13552 [Pistacia integerrima]|uniref:Uncharacterized protein n=1 Tax=Pistacia integerrima TaxID=434235 RepID=A0ACC0YBA8_9ROSI|nr:hypothetical protein Pint_13552 [Pistacia integerrima]
MNYWESQQASMVYRQKTGMVFGLSVNLVFVPTNKIWTFLLKILLLILHNIRARRCFPQICFSRAVSLNQFSIFLAIMYTALNRIGERLQYKQK